MRSGADDLPPIQQRELGRIAVSDEACNVGKARLAAQHGLVRAGLAEFVRVEDGSAQALSEGRTGFVCHITRLGREAHRALIGGQATLLQQRLKSLRAQRVAIESELIANGRQIEVAEMQLSRLEPRKRA